MRDPEHIRLAIEWMVKAPPAKWVREMHEHHGRTGTYRAQDIRRIMGDQTESVKIATDRIQAAQKLLQ